MQLSVEDISIWITENFEHVRIMETYGETTFFYNRDDRLKNGAYFLTIKQSDGPNDKASQLHRSGVFRVSWQLERAEFEKLFGSVPARPKKGDAIATEFDLSSLDTLLPHSVYGWMCWAMVLSPSREQFMEIQESISRAYAGAVKRFDKSLRTVK